jgi:hypothetical protein
MVTTPVIGMSGFAEGIDRISPFRVGSRTLVRRRGRSANQPLILRFWNSVCTASHAIQSLAVSHHDFFALI